MKMNNVGPETFLQGVGQYSYEAMMSTLGWLGMSDEELLMDLAGLAQMPGGQAPGLMTAIVNNAKEMNAKQQALKQARAKAAKASPMAASAIAQAKQRTAAPGTNVAKGVVQTMNVAAKKAVKAKSDEQMAKMLLKENDKRAAAAKAVAAMTAAREAATLANKAEKTRLATGLDMVANTLEAQAKYIDGVVARESGMAGQSMRTTALAATALNLRQQAKKLRNQSSLVAVQPDVPPQAPSAQRIADLANRFNIRTAGRDRFMQKKALVSVLGDLSDDPMAQAPDYNGALAYYGNDDVGRLMADIEFDNQSGAMAGLSRAVNGLGYTDTLPVYAQADSALQQGVTLAQKAYVTAVLPAAGLGGLGGGLGWDVFAAAGAKESKGYNENWCRTNVPSGATDSAKMYKGDVEKCLKDAPLAPPPWSCAGLGFRGVLDAGGVALCLAKGVGQWVTSGQAGKDIGAAQQTFQQTQQTMAQVTGQRPQQPPADTKPPMTMPSGVALESRSAATAGGSYSPARAGIPTYVYGIGAVAVLGAAYLFMMPKRA